MVYSFSCHLYGLSRGYNYFSKFPGKRFQEIWSHVLLQIFTMYLDLSYFEESKIFPCNRVKYREFMFMICINSCDTAEIKPDYHKNSNSDNVKESSTNNEQRERSKVQKTVSLARKRRGTHSNGDGSSSSTKQTFATAINQILHRRASVSSQRPKDLIAEINTNRLETTNNIQNASPPSPVAVNAPIKQQPQNQPSQNQSSHSTQQPPFQRLLRKKSIRTSNNGQYSPVSPSQSSPLSPTVEEDFSDSLSDIDSNNNLNNKRMQHGTNSSSNHSVNSSASSISSPRKQFLFEISSREQKLLISSQTSQTKDEKLLKKAKIFLDAKQRPKARIASLWSFTDFTSEFDQAQFFQQNAEDVFDRKQIVRRHLHQRNF
uniref:Uncharacterized protein n=1 Tax=Rhizophagus irregularis (strain DAOM 181602 / DAOM 197198 / MUCL 43194) TaxID=747089 RepID=U9U7G1_RHIID